MSTDKYKLEGHKAVPCEDLMEWARWFETADRHVAKTILKGPGNIDIKVSTVFLSLNHNWGEGNPILFETMVFGGPLDQRMERYGTWDEADAGHKRWVKKVNKQVKSNKVRD